MIDLIYGDALTELANLKPGSVDAIITDPPYGTTANKWDSIIDLSELWPLLKRVIKPNGIIVLFGSEPFSSLMRVSNLRDYRYDWIWKKPKGTGHLNAKKMPLNDFETISIFYAKPGIYNPQFTVAEPYTRINGGKDALNKGCYGKTKESNTTINDGYRYPKRVLEFQSDSQNYGSLHPTQKPVKLMEYFIKTYTNEGDTVLDFTMGSGTTGVACINTFRAFIGIENNLEYYDIAEDRILKHYIL